MINNEFIESLSDDHIEGAKQICDYLLDFHRSNAGGNISRYSEYLEIYALASSYFEVNEINYDLPDLGPDKKTNITNFVSFSSYLSRELEQILDKNSVEYFKSKYQARFKGEFCYEFTKGDIEKIQSNINELRNFINEYQDFEDGHRQRLLKRLEKLQSELHKKVSDLDRFWGLIGDAGVVIGKFGEDAKPMVDLIKDVADIIWRTQASAEELPSGTKSPLLSNGNKQDA